MLASVFLLFLFYSRALRYLWRLLPVCLPIKLFDIFYLSFCRSHIFLIPMYISKCISVSIEYFEYFTVYLLLDLALFFRPVIGGPFLLIFAYIYIFLSPSFSFLSLCFSSLFYSFSLLLVLCLLSFFLYLLLLHLTLSLIPSLIFISDHIFCASTISQFLAVSSLCTESAGTSTLRQSSNCGNVTKINLITATARLYNIIIIPGKTNAAQL